MTNKQRDPHAETVPPIFVTDGPTSSISKDKTLFSAWNIAFMAAVLTLCYLCIFRQDPYLRIIKFIPDRLLITFKITIMSITIAIPLGLLTGLGRLARNKIVNLIASTYVEIIRGIPLLMQLFYIYYALGPILGASATVAAVTALSFCYGAYMGEVFRAGILSVSKGQTEAAHSLGFNRFQTMFIVILPQAMRTIIPPVGNECIALLKDTSLVSVIAVADLLRRGREFASQTFLYFETYTVIALVYLIITLLLSRLLSHVEWRLSQYERLN